MCVDIYLVEGRESGGAQHALRAYAASESVVATVVVVNTQQLMWYLPVTKVFADVAHLR